LCLCFPRRFLLGGMSIWALSIACFAYYPGAFLLRDCGYLESICHAMSLEFMLGVFIASLVERKIFLPPLISMGSGLIWLSVAGYLCHAGLANHLITRPERVVWYGIPCFLIVYGLISQEKTRKVIFPRLFLLLGNASYSIYLIHPLLLMSTRTWFTSSNSVWMCVGASLGCAVLFPALCLPFYFWIEKPLLNLGRKVCCSLGLPC